MRALILCLSVGLTLAGCHTNPPQSALQQATPIKPAELPLEKQEQDIERTLDHIARSLEWQTKINNHTTEAINILSDCVRTDEITFREKHCGARTKSWLKEYELLMRQKPRF